MKHDCDEWDRCDLWQSTIHVSDMIMDSADAAQPLPCESTAAPHFTLVSPSPRGLMSGSAGATR